MGTTADPDIPQTRKPTAHSFHEPSALGLCALMMARTRDSEIGRIPTCQTLQTIRAEPVSRKNAEISMMRSQNNSLGPTA